MLFEFAADLEDSNRCKSRIWLEGGGSFLIIGVYVSNVKLVGPQSYDGS